MCTVQTLLPTAYFIHLFNLFRMCFDDFATYFARVDICHFVNTSFFSLKKTWSEALLHGEWTDGARGSKQDRNGGCREVSPNTFLNNPQVCNHRNRTGMRAVGRLALTHSSITPRYVTTETSSGDKSLPLPLYTFRYIHIGKVTMVTVVTMVTSCHFSR